MYESQGQSLRLIPYRRPSATLLTCLPATCHLSAYLISNILSSCHSSTINCYIPHRNLPCRTCFVSITALLDGSLGPLCLRGAVYGPSVTSVPTAPTAPTQAGKLQYLQVPCLACLGPGLSTTAHRPIKGQTVGLHRSCGCTRFRERKKHRKIPSMLAVFSGCVVQYHT